jgi:hypothetical protein
VREIIGILTLQRTDAIQDARHTDFFYLVTEKRHWEMNKTDSSAK